MARVRSRRLVIDADVGRSAGESEHPVSSACRGFLDAVRECKHRIVMTDAIQAEWERHRSKYAKKWLRSMWAKKQVVQIEVVRDERLRTRISNSVVSQTEKNAVGKDMHLIEAALATDKLIALRDEAVRAAFRAAAQPVKVLRRIVWVNPTNKGEAPVDWLRSGAKSERERQLGVS